MATPRERLEELRELKQQKLAASQLIETDRQKLERLRELKRQRMPEGDRLDAIIEPVAAIASSVPATVPAGFAGIAQALNPLAEEGAGERAVLSVQDALTRSPKTVAGQEGLQTVTDLGQAVTDAASVPSAILTAVASGLTGSDMLESLDNAATMFDQGIAKTSAEKVFEETNSPLAATTVELIPEAVASLFPATRAASKNSALKQKIANDIETGGTDKPLARFVTNGAGKLEKDKFAINAIKQGFDEGVIAAIKGSSKADKFKMKQMVSILEEGRRNTLFATKNRPSDIAGNSLLERVNHIKKVNKSAGQRLSVVAKSLKGKEVDSSAPIDRFLSNLDEMGIKIGDDLKPRYDGSDIEGLTGPQNAINNIVKRLASGKPGQAPDAWELHRMKRFIDENVTFGKSADGLSGRTENVLKELRRDIDGVLDSTFPKYDKVNKAFSDTINALDSLQSVAGQKMDLAGGNANKATGTLLRRIMSNAQSRVNLMDAVDEIEAISKQYGGKFEDDITVQMLFADELDTVFKPAARTSLQGQVGKEVARNAADVAAGQTVVNKVLDGGAAIISEKIMRVTPENGIKAIKGVLSR